MNKPEITVRSTSSNAAERNKIKKDRLEREMVRLCDADLIRRQAYSDRKQARLAARAARNSEAVA